MNEPLKMLRKMDKCSFETTICNCFWLLFERMSTGKGKTLLPMGANSNKETHLSDETWYEHKKTDEPAHDKTY